jgi:hypothetical protein
MTLSQLRPPSPQTLKRYGLTVEVWYNLLDFVDGRCPICQRQFTNDFRPVIDHEHGIKNWKKIKPEQKSSFVRGVTCNYCNRFRIPKRSKELPVVEIVTNLLNYLEDYSLRHNEESNDN